MSLLSSVLADSINDVSSTRKVYLLAAGLALLGVALIGVTVWFWRTSRHDPQLLAPLEVMGQKKFRTMDGAAQRRVLDEARPAGAEPMRWGVQRGDPSPGPEIDLAAINREKPEGYDDLREPVDEPREPFIAETAIAETAISEEDVAEPGTAEPDTAEPAVAESAVAESAVAEVADADDDDGDRDAGADVAPPTGVVDRGELEVVPQTNVVPSAEEPADVDEPSLVIVPLDHELASATDNAVEAAPSSGVPAVDVDDEQDEHDEGPGSSIDPLLRMFNRTDS